MTFDSAMSIIVLVNVVQEGWRKVFVILYYFIFTITLLYGLYFSLTGFIGILRKKKTQFLEVEARNRFAILVPARNEEAVIGNLIDSLEAQNYPKELYTIYVIPNNCIDRTEEVARNHGAMVIRCDEVTKTKGDVLNYAFRRLQKYAIDAYIVFDADNVVHPDFLKHMNNCLESGYEVAQGYRDAKNPSDNWLSGSYALFYLFQNVFFNRARMSLNGSASINGTGFMIKKSLIDTFGFETYTLTEDVEFTGQCALRGQKIAFVEEAITYDEYPTFFHASWKQRKRWSAGILECMKRYSWKLFKNYRKTQELSSLDMALVYLGPLWQVIGFVGTLMLMIFHFLGIHLYDLFSYFFAFGILFFVLSYFLGVVLELFVLWYKDKKISSVTTGIFLFPIFVMTWIPINIVCLIKKHTKWEEIRHNRSVEIKDVLN